MGASSKQQLTYFTKLRGLATVVWDPRNDTALAEFNKHGLYCTKDPTIIKTLQHMGYKEVTLEQIKEKGLLVPNEKDDIRLPGRGYIVEGEQPPLSTASMDAHGMSPMEAALNEDDEPQIKPKGRTLVR